MRQCVCDHCGWVAVALPSILPGWFHVEGAAHYELEPRELDFCGWVCMAAYARRADSEQDMPA